MKKKTYKYYLNILLATCMLLNMACKKLVEIDPQTGSIDEATVFTENSTAISAITGILATMSGQSGSFTNRSGISFLAALSADELSLTSTYTDDRHNAYYRNSLSAITPPVTGSDSWLPMFNLVYRCNAAIEGLTDERSEVLLPLVRKQLLGEAKFLRAFFYFYLTNLYGEVPLALTTDYKVNTQLPNSTKEDIYRSIISDLREAQTLLSAEYLNNTLTGSTPDRIRPTSWAATALLSRAYLYSGDYVNAEAQATEILNNIALFDTTSLNSVFLKNSKEAIWQLQPVDQFFNTREATLLITTNAGPNNNNPAFLSSQLLSAFEAGDNRAIYGNWIDTTIYLISGSNYGTVTHPYKYKVNANNPAITSQTGTQNMTEFLMVLRVGEQYLVRAEARAHQSKIQSALSDLDVIRKRARLPLLSATNPGISQSALLDAILHERQVELFTEWGHRWLDLKRTGKVDAVMSVVTPIKSQGQTSWESHQQLYPILQTDINQSPNLKQNAGY
ncbi:MAG: RagB/SusD family nutrient uptake outer membrane protein [Niabella sp.]